MDFPLSDPNGSSLELVAFLPRRWRLSSFHVAVLGVGFAVLCGCAPKPMIAYSVDTPPLILVPASAAGVVDGRSRFREIYCAVTDERGPDILEAVAAYPELQQRVSAVVSFAGAVGGSPVANTVKQSTLNLLQHLPGAECDPGDEGGLESLKPEMRKRWYANHRLPESIRYYSVITYPDADHLSSFLKSGYDDLSQVDSRNDGQLIFYDQLIPGSVLLGYVNADHWAIAVPINRNNPFIASTFVDKNAFPREVLAEAVVRFIEEDLNRGK